MSYNMMKGYDIYDRFTVEHFPLSQIIIFDDQFFCSRQYIDPFFQLQLVLQISYRVLLSLK
jgi:hypothetical protein